MASARVHRGAALLLLYLGLTACTVVGPDYQAPPAPALPSAWEPARAQEQARSVGAWWQRFNDPVLDELIARSARQNLSIEAAGLRIVQARAALGISDALVFPQQQQINANYSGLYRDEDWFKSASAHGRCLQGSPLVVHELNRGKACLHLLGIFAAIVLWNGAMILFAHQFTRDETRIGGDEDGMRIRECLDLSAHSREKHDIIAGLRVLLDFNEILDVFRPLIREAGCRNRHGGWRCGGLGIR